MDALVNRKRKCLEAESTEGRSVGEVTAPLATELRRVFVMCGSGPLKIGARGSPGVQMFLPRFWMLFQPIHLHVVEFEGLECAFASFLSSVGLLGVHLEVYTSRLVGCLLGELDNQLHRL